MLTNGNRRQRNDPTKLNKSVGCRLSVSVDAVWIDLSKKKKNPMLAQLEGKSSAFHNAET